MIFERKVLWLYMLQKVGCYNSKKNLQKLLGFTETEIGRGSFTIDNSVEIYGIDKMLLKCYRIDGSNGTGGRQPATYNFRTDKPLVLRKTKKSSDRFYNKTKKLNQKFTFHVEDDEKNRKKFFNEPSSFTKLSKK